MFWRAICIIFILFLSISLRRYFFILSLCKKGCFQHISQLHVKEVIEHADVCIAYRGSSAYVIYSDADESFMEFFVSKDSFCYEGNYFNKNSSLAHEGCFESINNHYMI